MLSNNIKGNAKGPRVVVEGDSTPIIRSRRQSAAWVGPPEVPNSIRDQLGGGSRPIPTAVATAAVLLQQNTNDTKYGSLGRDFDEAFMLKSTAAPAGAYIVEVRKSSTRFISAFLPFLPTYNYHIFIVLTADNIRFKHKYDLCSTLWFVLQVSQPHPRAQDVVTMMTNLK